jgi:hypothetical protein
MAAVVWMTRLVLPLPVRLGLGAAVYTVAMLALVGPRVAAARFGWLR